MALLFLFVVLGFGLYLAAKAAPRGSPANAPLRRRAFAFVGRSAGTLAGALVASWIVVAVMSTGLGMAILITASLLIPVYAAEELFAVRWKRLKTIKILLFPCILGILVLGSVLQAVESSRAVPNAEYSRYSRDGYVFELNTDPVFLEEEATLRLREDLPAMEGSTSFSGLLKAVAAAVYDVPGAQERAWASRTPNAYDNLLRGSCRMVIAFYPSPEQIARFSERGIALRFTPIGREAFVFFVNPGNPVDDVSSEDLRKIYEGKLDNWRRLGGRNQSIEAYQRQTNSGSQSRMERFMAGRDLTKPPTEYYIWDMAGIVTRVAGYRNDENAIGYSFLYFVKGMMGGGGVKILKVDGVAPALESIRDGSYPLLDDIYVVTADRPHPNTDAVVDWLLSPQGQRLVLANGYAPVAPTE